MYIIKLFIFSILMLLQNYGLFAQYTPNSWATENTSGMVGRRWSASFVIGNSIYVGTGYPASTTWIADFWQYNTVTNTWISRASFPGAARADAIGFSIGGYGYIGLGDDATTYYKDMYRYDPATDSWTSVGTISSLPSATGSAGAVAFSINGKGYVCLGSGPYSNNLYQYSPATNTWVDMMSPFPGAARQEAVCFVIGNNAYVGTGTNGTLSYSDFYSYDATLNAWTSLGTGGTLPGGGRSAGVGFSICGNGYAGLGPGNDFYQYNPSSNSWSLMNSFIGTDLQGLAYGAVNTGDTAFGFVGLGEEGGSPVKFFKYSPPLSCVPSLSVDKIIANDEFSILPNPSSSAITVKSTGKISVITILNLLGQTVFSKDYNTEIAEIDVSNLSNGIYIIKINDQQIRKFIKE